MKKKLPSILMFLLLCCCFVLISLGEVYALAESNQLEVERMLDSTTYANDSLLIVLTEDKSKDNKYYTVEDFTEINCKKVDNIFIKDKYCPDDIKSNFKQIISVKLKDSGKNEIAKAIKKLSSRTDVEFVSPDFMINICSTTPNDIKYADQWGLTKIKAYEAWDEETGSGLVKVGILDSGIDGVHPDLSANISQTLNRDFTSGQMVEVSIPTDPNGHGTHVAGIVGAVGNNNIGVAGVCWDVELVSLRCLNQNGEGQLSWLADAISCANTMGLDIINLSLSWRSNESSYHDAIEVCINNFSGLVVAAAGNHNVNCDNSTYYPAGLDCDNMIIVGASDSDDEKSNWNGFNNLWGLLGNSQSNYGKNSVDIFAPGTDIMSTLPSNSWGEMSGTSMAAPFVTGAAALILSKYPCLSVNELKDTILENGEVVDGLSEYCATGSILNVDDALQNCEPTHIYELTSNNSSTHSKVCVCGNTIVENHMFLNWNSTETGTHTGLCACGQSATEYHSYTYSNVTATTHKQTCTVCGYNTVIPHLWRVINKTVTGHVKQCNCGHTVDEAHTWVQNALGGYMCSVCRQTGNFIPGIQSLLTPAGRLTLQAANLQHGQVALIEGLPIIYFNGEYYLLSDSTTQVPYPIPPALQTE